MHLGELRLHQRALHAAGEVARDRADGVQRILERLAHRLELFAGLLEAHERDERAQDLVGALEDEIDARVAHRALVRIFLGISDTIGDLQRFVRGAEGEF